mmetsp:Transcript_40484/g.130982  ORF Transcript_40484/g.130982 Transcript_40484/m.130982 type:complete len:295 (-) Transcript_40484:997-1881(-)
MGTEGGGCRGDGGGMVSGGGGPARAGKRKPGVGAGAARGRLKAGSLAKRVGAGKAGPGDTCASGVAGRGRGRGAAVGGRVWEALHMGEGTLEEGALVSVEASPLFTGRLTSPPAGVAPAGQALLGPGLLGGREGTRTLGVRSTRPAAVASGELSIARGLGSTAVAASSPARASSAGGRVGDIMRRQTGTSRRFASISERRKSGVSTGCPSASVRGWMREVPVRSTASAAALSCSPSWRHSWAASSRPSSSSMRLRSSSGSSTLEPGLGASERLMAAMAPPRTCSRCLCIRHAIR